MVFVYFILFGRVCFSPCIVKNWKYEFHCELCQLENVPCRRPTFFYRVGIAVVVVSGVHTKARMERTFILGAEGGEGDDVCQAYILFRKWYSNLLSLRIIKCSLAVWVLIILTTSLYAIYAWVCLLALYVCMSTCLHVVMNGIQHPASTTCTWIYRYTNMYASRIRFWSVRVKSFSTWISQNFNGRISLFSRCLAAWLLFHVDITVHMQ